MKILVGSGDDALRRFLGHLLSGAQGEVRMVSRSGDLLKAVLESDYDLAVFPLQLGGMTGLETLAILKRLRPKLPVFILSDDRSADVRAEAMEAGALHYFVLPLNPQAMIAAVNAVGGNAGVEIHGEERMIRA